mmetsp:Transcript_113701/g.367369  ORF Transcript_113701/g.367369 Transcript_113701/m.367369 type:complete len:431 (-) Transcript_113701:243-1535(-)
MAKLETACARVSEAFPEAPAVEGEAAALLVFASASEAEPLRRRACSAAAWVLRGALLAGVLAAAWLGRPQGPLLHLRFAPDVQQSGQDSQAASVGAALSLWAPPTAARVPPAPHDAAPALAAPPTCLVGGELPRLWKHAEGGGPPLEVRLLTYNLFWWNLFGVRKGNGGSASRLIAESGRSQPHDIMGFQECMDPQRVLSEAGLSQDYTIFSGDGSGTAATCMAFRNSSWLLLAHGSEYVAEDTKAQYFGKRAAQWMRLRHKASGRALFFMNHHGPLPINSGGRCGGVATAYNLLQLITWNAHRGDVVILVGDFNADASSSTIQHLEKRLHKSYTGTADGGIDNVFSNLADGRVISRMNLGTGGSDHDALSVVLELGADGGPALGEAAPRAAARGEDTAAPSFPAAQLRGGSGRPEPEAGGTARRPMYFQ